MLDLDELERLIAVTDAKDANTRKLGTIEDMQERYLFRAGCRALIARLRATEELVRAAFDEGLGWYSGYAPPDADAEDWINSKAHAALDRLRRGEVA